MLINGKTGKTVYPKRGNRQEDPIPLYVFKICAEYLGRYSFHVTQRNLIIGIKLKKDSPNKSYLMFVDDSFIFC